MNKVLPPGNSPEGSAPLEGGQSFTPGPWAWGLDDIDAIWAVNCPADGGNVICEPPESGVASLGRWPANARLIAAAPDLLDACKALIDFATSAPPIELIKRLDACVVKAATAYAKATGQ